MIKPFALRESDLFLRRQGRLDTMLSEMGRALQVLGGAAVAGRPNPAGKPAAAPPELSPAEQKHAAGLMRVNHVGEVCAQALYRGQAVFCGDAQIKHLFSQAASEEMDHLAWCQDRLQELNSRPSYLNPLWYVGSLTLGMAAGWAGRSKNLGFMAETESQVEQHLAEHLKLLPSQDGRSRRIVEQMRDDEIRHRTTAQEHGGLPLPKPVRLAMRGMAKLMTRTSYWI
ncbi:MAG: 2-polyprenyl-3-methyl-6-methoxy-1,4-benzoquinone monooxygenase [Candidimonas sp.]|nr:MAG: 2-polyprenyl-3-methyl-6-methoxy-1,4-benzoquinone monooxygenase [Candidimonas sp.]TAM21195.1 MAG: 2-polyprenyl-3-methyl-6-methoxy-1,4-benzoquinone monooxygenase [Candidimonas sp.]TAM76621.1 MAG: 2-polyprenyl-3-methyl-6-methoxy-1,4-benzoquinone monooxygenase [Candidimonas sp.]